MTNHTYPEQPAGTQPRNTALTPIYEAKNPVTGAQYVIYALTPGDETSLHTVAHIAAERPLSAPTVCQVPAAELIAYSVGAVGVLGAAGSEIEVWANTTTGALRAALPE